MSRVKAALKAAKLNDPAESQTSPLARYLIALGQMVVVTLLWSSSFPIHKALIKQGMPPISLAAYRYFSAALILAGVLGFRNRMRNQAENHRQRLTPIHWFLIIGIGLFMYTAQGIHLTALSLISATDSGLVSMTFLPLAVAVLVGLLEKNPPTRAQLVGLAILIAGIVVYFPHDIGSARMSGVLLNIMSSSMWAVATVLTHMAINRMKITSLSLTMLSMIVGSGMLLLVALVHDKFYVPDVGQVLWLAYLAIVNTAIGFALFNHTMKTLGAFEITALQDSMVIQIGILSAIFLGESITRPMGFGMVLVVCGIAVIQYYAPSLAGVAGSSERHR